MGPAKIVEGAHDGSGQRHAVVVARWNDFITLRLLEGVRDGLASHNVAEDAVSIFYVPGAFELGATAKKLASSGNYDSVICLGCVIRGDTDHYQFVAGETSRLIAQASYDTGIPVIFGVLTTNNVDQAMERAGKKEGNKGYEAAVTAIEMAALYRKIGGGK